MAISDLVYQNKDFLDIFSDKNYPKFILMNSNISPPPPWIFFCPTKNDTEGKYLDAIFIRMIWKKW